MVFISLSSLFFYIIILRADTCDNSLIKREIEAEDCSKNK